MDKLLEQLRRIWNSQDIRKNILFILAMLTLVQIGRASCRERV